MTKPQTTKLAEPYNQTVMQIGQYELRFPILVRSGDKPPYATEQHFMVERIDGEAMSISPSNLEKLFDELWKGF